jgi:hypothetical protein
MSGQPHNPLRDAARETMHVARETKSPWFEKVAIATMITSALTTKAFAVMHMWHTLKRDQERERDRERDRERERSRQNELPPYRTGHGGTATADGGEERRWARGEERGDQIRGQHGR